MEIRAATLEDIPEILAIYNDVIATSTAVYYDHPVTLENRLAWFHSRIDQGFPVLVAIEDNTVIGFSTFGTFRASPCYIHTVEHTVHVSADYRGRGAGRALVKALFPYAQASGKHVMIAAVDAANQQSVAFHESLGFHQVAHFREVGFKFGRWLDLLFLQRILEKPSQQAD